MERKVCTIGEWLDVWYEVYAVPEYAPKTPRNFTEMSERGYRGVSRKSKAHFKVRRIRRVSPHMLRHTFATRMIENGSMQKSLALIIGHSNPAFTLRRYVHRITHPSTSKCVAFQAYSSKPATLPLFKTEKPTHHYRRVGFTFAILCFLCVIRTIWLRV